MLLTKVYLLFIYILFYELTIITIVALIVTIKKLSNKKNTSLSGR